MVRKTHKGTVGKTNITQNNRPHIGPGIGFKELNLTTGKEIAEASKTVDKNFEN